MYVSHNALWGIRNTDREIENGEVWKTTLIFELKRKKYWYVVWNGKKKRKNDNCTTICTLHNKIKHVECIK